MENKDLIALVHDPNFNKPLSELNKDYTKKGQIILITKIKQNERN